MILIKNLRKEKPTNEWDIKVDRSSVLGNPFFMMYESQRDAVCDKYEEYFYKTIKENDDFKEAVYELYDLLKEYGKLNLFCWCAPKRCHAETIKAYLETLAKKDKSKK